MNSPLRPRHWVAIGLGLAACLTLSVLFTQGDVAPKFVGPPEPQVKITSGTVRAGDVFALLMQKSGVPPMQIAPVQKALAKLYDLRRIQPGDVFEIVSSTDGIFQKLIYRTDPINSYRVVRSSQNAFSADLEKTETVWVEKRVSGKVTDSMYRELLKQGYSDAFVGNFVADLADNIFGWRIDFFTEQRPGDTFEALMEQEYPVGGDAPLWNGRGRILAARYTGKATRVKENIAIRFQEPGAKRADYYDEEGKAVRRAFLRAPFTHGAFRVSSGFNPKRFHPILRTYRPHHGTDYAAARGTPVSAIGKGTVVRAEWYKGYGNCVDVRHNSKYVSRYGHLSKIAVRRGESVAQGQYLGRVGSTGLSTGPHLHFEMLVDGTQQNFLRMSFAAASSVSTPNLPEFKRVRDEILSRLDRNKTTPKLSMIPKKQK